NFLFVVVRAHATTLTVFLRRGFGSEALGWPGLWALLLLALAALGSPVMGYYLVAWLVALICQRALTLTSRERRHSLDDGYPWLAMWLAKNPASACGVVEPILCLVVGTVLGAMAEVCERPWLFGLAG